LLRWAIVTVGFVSVMLFVTASLLALAGGVLAGEEQGGGPSKEPPSPPKVLLSRSELEGLVERMRGEDRRIMRWHARSFTRKAQKEGGCDALSSALDLIVATADSTAHPENEFDDDVAARQALALEYVTFCVTDNPALRTAVSTAAGIHKAVVALLASPEPSVSASAAHVVYIGSFSNKANHFGFFRAGAIPALTDIILRYGPVPATDASSSSAEKASSSGGSPGTVRADQAMWAMAALQNLAASYCRTPDDGRCYWHWVSAEGAPFHAVGIAEKSLPVTSEGTSMRVTALREPRLVPHLVRLACELGVRGEMSETNPFPGDNAAVGRDEDSPNLVSWSAAGALKNLALDPEGRSQMKALESKLLPCLCTMVKKSGDWLEQNKAGGALSHLRYGGDPCWWSDQGDKKQQEQVLECVDGNFFDGSYHCGDYVNPSNEECRAVDEIESSITASQTCCGCGGGMRLVEDRKATKHDKEL
jgi:hypothetical protein